MVDGDPWIRVTADDMVAYLERDGLEVGFKQVQRSLKRLGDLGLVRRAQRFIHRYDRRMWFAPSVAHPEQSVGSLVNDRKDANDLSSKSFSSKTVSSNVLGAGAPPTAKKTEIDREDSQEPNPTASTASAATAQRFDREGDTPRQTQENPSGTSLAPEVGTPTREPQGPPVTSERPLGDPKNHRGVEPGATKPRTASSGFLSMPSILARCLQMGGYSSIDEWEPPAPVSPKAIISKDGRRLNVADGVTAPLR